MTTYSTSYEMDDLDDDNGGSISRRQNVKPDSNELSGDQAELLKLGKTPILKVIMLDFRSSARGQG